MATKKELKIYGDLLYQHKPTIRAILLRILIDYFAKKNRRRKSVYIDDIPLEEKIKEDKILAEKPEYANYFAIVNDGMVKEIIIVNPEIAELFMQKSTKIVGFNNNEQPVKKGTKFLKGTFIFDTEQEGQNDKEN